MSKEKAVENIKEALKYTAKTSLIGTSPAEVACCFLGRSFIIKST